MESMEISAFPKGMLEKLLEMSKASYKANGVLKNGYKPIPLPVLTPEKSFTPPPPKSVYRSPASIIKPPGSKALRDSALENSKKKLILPSASEGVLNGSHKADVDASAGALRAMHSQIASDASPLQGDENAEKGSRKRERGRASRGTGASRKRIKANQSTSVVSTGVIDLDIGAPSSRRRATAKGVRQRQLAIKEEGGQKPQTSGQSRNVAKKLEKKESVVVSVTKNEPPFSTGLCSGQIDPEIGGLLGIYGLKAKIPNLTKYAEDVSLEKLIAGDYKPRTSASIGSVPKRSGMEDVFKDQIRTILELLPTLKNTQAPMLRKSPPSANYMECRPKKLDLESIPQPEDDECALLNDEKFKHMDDGSEDIAPSRSPFKGSTAFSVDNLPLFPPNDFLSTLKLQPPDPSEYLLSQTRDNLGSRDAQIRIKAGSCYSKNCSLPPLPFSLKSTQRLFDTDHDKDRRVTHWLREGSPKCHFKEKKGSWFGAWNERGPADSFFSEKSRSPRKDGLIEIDLNKQSIEDVEAGTITSSCITSIHLETVYPPASSAQETLGKPQQSWGSQERTEIVKIEGRINVNTSGRDGSLSREENVYIQGQQEVVCTAENVTSRLAMTGGSNAPIACQLLTESEGASRHQNSRSCVVLDASVTEASCTPDVLPIPHIKPNPKCSSVQNIWHDTPSSPGVKAAARLLCSMANSLTPFYLKKNQAQKRAFSSYPEKATPRAPKFAKREVCSDADARSRGYVRGEAFIPEAEVSVHTRASGSEMRNSPSEIIAMQAGPVEPNVSALCGVQERLTSSKSTASRCTSKSSFESDRSQKCAREHSRGISMETNSKVSRREMPPPPILVSVKVPTSASKELKGNNASVPKIVLQYSQKPQGMGIISDTKASTKHFAPAQGVNKTSRPRSITVRSTSTHQITQQCATKFPAVNSRKKSLSIFGDIRQRPRKDFLQRKLLRD